MRQAHKTKMGPTQKLGSWQAIKLPLAIGNTMMGSEITCSFELSMKYVADPQHGPLSLYTKGRFTWGPKSQVPSRTLM